MNCLFVMRDVCVDACDYVLAFASACASSASCQLKSLRANRCNYPREALQATYQGVNVAAHTLGSAVSVLCGCEHKKRT